MARARVTLVVAVASDARTERRGRPRKEIPRGDADGVRRHLAALESRFPSLCARGSESATPVSARDVGRGGGARRGAHVDVSERGEVATRVSDAGRGNGDASTRAAARVGARRSVESRKKIAEAQRERWRNARAEANASAVEAMVSVGNEEEAFASRKRESASKERTARLTKLIAMKKSTTRAEKIAASSVKVNQFSHELSTYTRLRAELASWSDGFEKAKGRKPNFKDVENTRIPWLIDSFQEYVKLRNKLIAETPNIRGEVGKLAKQTLPAPRSIPSGGELRLSIDDEGDTSEDARFSLFNFR